MHSLASPTANLEYSDLIIAPLIGHRHRTITSRYVHDADDVLLAAADAVVVKTATVMDGRAVAWARPAR